MAPGTAQPHLSVAPPTSNDPTQAQTQSQDDIPPPISPVSRVGSFPHRTVSAAPTNSFIDTATPAINSTPIELDGTPTSPQTVQTRKASLAAVEPSATKPDTPANPAAVLVDIPGTPGARELELAEKREGERVAEAVVGGAGGQK